MSDFGQLMILGSLTSLPNWKKEWYEELKLPQLKSLAKAAGVKVSGTKADLVHKLTSDLKIRQVLDASNPDLRTICIDKGLKTSGNKKDLVERILIHQRDAAQASIVASGTKRASDSNSSANKKTKTTSASSDQSNKVYNKVKKIINRGDKYMNNHWQSKQHAHDVYTVVKGILQKECTTKKAQNDPSIAFNLAKSALKSLNDNFQVSYLAFES
jgi:hypothetical protein